MDVRTETWCDRDEHKLYEYYVDFNEWLDSEDAAEVREANKVDGISVPSKAFYAGDKEAYDQAFKEYREKRRNEVLNERYLCEQFTDNHWFDRNIQRFDQLVERLESGDVVPFIGAGLSVAGGFPSWEDHLRTQGRTAGIDPAHTETLLLSGQYEAVIEEIETKRGRDVFIQEIRDVFSRTGRITDTPLLVTELFPDTVITTNYDRLIEQAFDTGEKNATHNRRVALVYGDYVVVIHVSLKKHSATFVTAYIAGRETIDKTRKNPPWTGGLMGTENK